MAVLYDYYYDSINEKVNEDNNGWGKRVDFFWGIKNSFFVVVFFWTEKFTSEDIRFIGVGQEFLQAYSCLKGWFLSVSWGTPDTPKTTRHYVTKGYKVGPQLGPPIADASWTTNDKYSSPKYLDVILVEYLAHYFGYTLSVVEQQKNVSRVPQKSLDTIVL